MTAYQTARAVVDVARDRELPFMAAAIAHYALASLVPLLLFVVAMASLFGTEAAVERFVQNRLSDVLSGPGQELVVNALTGATGAVGAGLVSIVVTFWSASKVFRGLEVAFAKLYDVEATPSLLEQLLNAVVVLALLALTVAAMVGVGLVVSTISWAIPFPTLWGTLLLLVTVFVGLLPVYYVLTPVDTDLRGVLPGAALGAVGLVALQVLFVYYARYAGRYEALGVLGALLLFVLWLYVGGIVVLLGGALNYVTRHGSVRAGT
jgi:membrane protein